MIRGSEVNVVVGVTDSLFLGANPNRLAILVSSPAANVVWITTKGVAAVGTGFPIRVGTAPIALHRTEVGDWICSNLRCITVTAAETLGVIEVLDK